uniref:Protein preY, mitochondrial n=1 Tax=Canis lupus familiaris TaxID=9615 RepID=A0A8P0TGK3_CANLF
SLGSVCHRGYTPLPTSPIGAFMCPGCGGQQASQRTGDPAHAFHGVPLEFLVCPLSEKPLRYEASTNELINEESGIAHLIIDGIPNVVPPAARMTHQKQKQEAMEQGRLGGSVGEASAFSLGQVLIPWDQALHRAPCFSFSLCSPCLFSLFLSWINNFFFLKEEME